MMKSRGPGYATHKNELKHLGLDILSLVYISILGGGFKYVLFSSLFGEMIQFD